MIQFKGRGVIQNREALLSFGDQGLRRDLLDILEAGIQAGDPGQGTRRMVRCAGDELTVGECRYPLDEIENIYVVGAGKGSFPIAEALEEILGPRIAAGVVVVKRGEKRRLKRIEIHEAGHPIPDEASLTGARKILELADRAGEKDLVFALITGGSSALVTRPMGDITLTDMQVLNERLLKSGAVIQEINAVRKHVCEMKGGRLVAHIQPAQAITLTLDTAQEGMPWPDMCLPDPSTFQEAIQVLERYDLWDEVPSSIQKFLREGKNHPEWETIKRLEGMKAQMVSVGDPVTMCLAAVKKIRALKYNPVLLSTKLEGEAREAGICLAGIAREIIRYGRPFQRPCGLVSGGETTVTVKGESGKGGPNQEFVLALASKLKDVGAFACAAVDSDGTDGPTDIAGGIVDHRTIAEAEGTFPQIGDSLKLHNSSEALEKLHGIILTGHTGTNLQHLRVILLP